MLKNIYRQAGMLVPVTSLPWMSAMGRPMQRYQKNNFGEFSAYFYKEAGEIYYEAERLDILAKEIYEFHTLKPARLARQLADYRRATAALFRVYRKNCKLNLRLFSKQELIKYIDSVWKTYQDFWAPSIFIDSFDPSFDYRIVAAVAKEYRLNPKEVEMLTVPVDFSFIAKRRLNFLKIALNFIKKHRHIKEREIKEFIVNDPGVTQYREDFDWHQSNYAQIKHITNGQIYSELRVIIRNPQKAKQEFNTLHLYKKRHHQMIKDICQRHQLKLNPLVYFQKLIYWREDRKKFNLMGFHIIDSITREISRRLSIPYQDIKYAIYPELKDILNGLLNKAILTHRRKLGVMVIMRPQGSTILTGAKAHRLRDYYQNLLLGNQNKREINGQGASEGIVEGAVRIVLVKNDFKKVRRGDILVTHMTRPEFLPVIKKVAAIVTDEGGITCHAAIVAREMKKPCVIGTKIATKVLKDGDLVEVDAINGIVRKLK